MRRFLVLDFMVFKDPDLGRLGIQNRKLFCYSRLLGPSCYSEYARIVLDTGATCTVIPRRLHEQAGSQLDFDPDGITRQGINEHCSFRAVVQEVELELNDSFNRVVFRSLSYLADTDDVPFVLGLHDISSRFSLVTHDWGGILVLR